MKLKQSMVTLSSAAMLFASVVAPMSAFAESTKTTTQQSDAQSISSNQYPTITIKNNKLTKDIIKAGNSITKYIQLGQDNLYHIDPKAKSLFSSEVFQSYSNSVDSVNQALQQKLLKIENGKPVPNASSDSNTSGIHSNVYANPYWWGFAITFNEQETQDEIYYLNQSGQVWQLVAVVGAAIAVANPPAGAAVSAAAVIVSVGSFMIANSMSHNDKGRGVTLNLHWLPFIYFASTPN